MRQILDEDGSSASPAAGGEDPFRSGSRFRLRWFTPTTEVPLCGHATLAAAAALFKVTGFLKWHPWPDSLLYSNRLCVHNIL